MRQHKRNAPVKLAEEVTVELTGIAHGGEAVGRNEGQAVFVTGGIPGEVVFVDLYRERKALLSGRIRAVLKESPHRVSPPCPYFGYCGGCQWQHIAYEEQLALKRRIVSEQLEHIGGFTDPPVQATIPSPAQWEYRNHVRFSAGRHGHLGFKRPASHRFLAIDRCLISHSRINEVLAEVQGQGARLHQVVMRVGQHTGDFLLYPALDTAQSDAIANDELTEELLGHRFHISLSSFFQVNTLQAERLARVVVDMLALSGSEVLVDAYSGVGTFAVLLSGKVKQVIGIEESTSATNNAERNALGLANVRFVVGKTEEVLPKLPMEVDAVVLDPSRVGCAPGVLSALLAKRPGKIVYVSCDPATLARDIRLLVAGGYLLRGVQPLDMFPQTYHIETVVSLESERD